MRQNNCTGGINTLQGNNHTLYRFYTTSRSKHVNPFFWLCTNIQFECISCKVKPLKSNKSSLTASDHHNYNGTNDDNRVQQSSYLKIVINQNITHNINTH